MKVKAMLIVGFLSILAATGVVTATESVASEPNGVAGVARIGHGGSIYSFSRPQSVQPAGCNGEWQQVLV